jgi:class 3 adenylate cyclase
VEITDKVRVLVERLTRSQTRAVQLLETYDLPEYADLWEKDPEGPRLYRAFSRELVKQGYPTTGLSLARRGLKARPGDSVLAYNLAWAYARGGNPTSAGIALTPLLEQACDPVRSASLDARLRMDVIALRGRVFKDLYRRSPPGTPARVQLAGESADWYVRASGVEGADFFPLGNAALMRLLQGKAAEALGRAEEAGPPAAEARALAATTREGVAAAAAAGRTDAWLPAADGLMLALLGRHDEAIGQFERAVDAMARRDLGSLSALLGDLRLLAEVGAIEDPVRLQRKFGSAVAFSGHLIDPPGRRPPRFPNDPVLVDRVKREIRARLEAVNARFGFCSLGSGADILFAEAMIEREAEHSVELHVVLPFAADDFLKTSVGYGAARYRAWEDRFRGVLGRLPPDQVHYATTEPYLGSDRLYAYANQFLQGMAAVRSAQCGIVPRALVVLDPDSDPRVGGTKHFLDLWTRLGHPADVIDLRVLRDEVSPLFEPEPGAAPAPWPASELPRQVRAMLFADVAGFSQMREEFHPRFFRQFSSAIAAVRAEAGGAVLQTNTWGDGIFVVFETVVAAARFALALLDRLRDGMNWTGMGFANPNPLRVGLHAGPVFEMDTDPVLGRRNFFGQHVNRTARIEPVTMPGCAYASEQFAALLTVEASDEFVCEFVGTEELPKKSGAVVLYRVQAAARTG